MFSMYEEVMLTIFAVWLVAMMMGMR
jgi:hypothetical protein